MAKKVLQPTKENKRLNDKMQKFVECQDEVVDKIRIKQGELPCKQFEARNSPLTDLWEVKHIRTIYHICIAVLIGLFFNTAASDYLSRGRARLGFSLILKGFAKFHLFIIIWVCMFLTSFVIYFGFKLWATARVQLTPKSVKLKLWDMSCLGLFIFFYPSFMYFCTAAVIKYELPIAMSMAVLMEMTRFLMKSHAFVRTNTPKVIKYKMHAEDQVICPKISKFLYFSFAPTAVYQDDYPRSKGIRWNYVGKCFMEFTAAIFFLSFVIEKFFIPTFEDYGLKSHMWQQIVVTIFENFVPAILILLSIFYMLLHAWLNAFAEMLKFADRLFYKDWWTSASYERYYRTWNVTVHDWLYTYIYKDFYEIVLPKNKPAARYMVFFTSAVFHDYILGIAFRFYLPNHLVHFFAVGVAMNFIKIRHHSVGNIFLWYTLALGCSINAALYGMEYYSRQNCHVENATLSSYFVPQIFTYNK